MARSAIHPGEHLAEAINAIGITAAQLARDIRVPPNRITGILHFTRAITADTALRLARYFGTSAAFWMNLQQLYELRRAEQESAFAGDQREMTGEASTVGQHPADVADFTYQRELQQTTEKFLGRQADQVEAAIRAREKGTYGTCQECGKHIPDERLQARPEATLCVDCQRRLETRQTV